MGTAMIWETFMQFVRFFVVLTIISAIGGVLGWAKRRWLD